MHKRSPLAIVFVLVLVFFLQVYFAMIDESDTWDESTISAIGYLHIKKGNFEIGRENPTLNGLLLAIPYLIIDPELPVIPEEIVHKKGFQATFGKIFYYGLSNNNPSELIFWSRIPVVICTLLLAFFLFKWTSLLCGHKAAVIALILFVFCPEMLSYGRIASSDMLCTVFMFLSVYAFYNYSDNPGLKAVILLGILVGIALIAKYTSLLLILILILLSLLNLLFWSNKKTTLKKELCTILLSSVIALIVIGLSYNGSMDISLYYKGMKSIYTQNIDTYQYYLMGKHSKNPWWYFYIAAFLVKTPIVLLVSFLFGTVKILKQGHRDNWKTASFLLIPVIAIFTASFTDKANLGIRRILPVYPYVIVLGAYFISSSKILDKKRLWIIPLLWYVINSLYYYPFHLAYFNEMVGGPENGTQYLDESNIDWGQELPRLKRYMEEEGIENISLHYFGWAAPRYYGIKYKVPPIKELLNPKKDRYYAISTHYLVKYQTLIDKYGPKIDWLKNYRPIKRIGYSIYIYRF